MEKPPLFVELCAGSAAVTLRLIGGPRCLPPASYIGSKRFYSDAILAVLGLRAGQGAGSVILVEAGPWAKVWRMLMSPGGCEAVAGMLRTLEGEDPRAVWDGLQAEIAVDEWMPPAVAAWLMLGAWSFREGIPSSGFARSKAYDAPWVASTGEVGMRRVPTPGKLADAVLALASVQWPYTVVCMEDAAGLKPAQLPPGVVMFMDPPYQGCTGYGADLPRASVLEVARRWSDAGATVCVSEAEPLPLDGWHHVEITDCRRVQKRTFSKQKREWLTLNRRPAWRPEKQGDLFGRCEVQP